VGRKTCRPVPGFIHDLIHVAVNCLDRNAELQSIIQAVVDAGTRNGWLAGHLTVGFGEFVETVHHTDIAGARPDGMGDHTEGTRNAQSLVVGISACNRV
jgi:hypothetical protein